MKKYKSIKIFIMIILLFLSINFISNASKYPKPSAVRVRDGQAVWMGNKDGNIDIYHQDLNTNVITRITDNEAHQAFPSTSGNYIVWLDSRNHLNEEGYFDIYMYDMVNKTEKKVSDKKVDFNIPVVDGKYIYWQYEEANNEGIFKGVKMYNIETETIKTISSPGARPKAVLAKDDYAVWRDGRGQYDDNLYLYNSVVGIEEQVTNSPNDMYGFYIDGDQIVYVRMNDYKKSHIYLYDIKTGVTTKITDEPRDYSVSTFSDGNIILRDNGVLECINIKNKTISLLDIPVDGRVRGIFLEGDTLYWFDGYGFIKDTLSASIERYKATAPDLDIIDKTIEKNIIVDNGYTLRSDDTAF